METNTEKKWVEKAEEAEESGYLGPEKTLEELQKEE